LLLGGTALFSYGVVHQAESKLVTHFVLELQQNLYFVGLVLTYLLWAAVLKLRETRTRLIQLVLSLGVYFSLLAANYALRNLYPGLSTLLQILPPLFGCFLPAAWCMPSGGFRKKRASFRRAWRCSDDGRFYSCVLDYLPAAIFYFLLPVADRFLCSGADFPGSSGSDRNGASGSRRRICASRAAVATLPGAP